MTRLAQRLERPGPELCHVAAVAFDVMNFRRRLNPWQAIFAERILGEEAGPEF